jgi:acyl carrier protein
MSETIAEAVKRVLVEHLGLNPVRVTENASLIDDLGADSLDCIEVTMAMEEEFGVSFDDDEIEKLVTVKDIIVAVTDKRREASAA